MTTKLMYAALVGGLLSLPFGMSAQTDPEAGKFLDRLMDEGDRVWEKQLVASNAQIHSKDVKAQRTAKIQVVGQINIAMNNIKAMKDYKTSKLRQQHINLFETLLKTYNNDYEKLFSLATNAEESVETMTVYLDLKEQANNKVNQLADSVRALDMAFAKEYGINLTITEDQNSKKFTAAMAAVGDYRRKVFLEHFKIEKAYAPIIDDLNKGKGKKLERLIPNLQQTCEQVLAEVEKIGAYNGDNRLQKSVKDEAEFYLAECKKNMPAIAKLMAKPQLETQEEVNFYNNWNKDFITKLNKNTQKYGEEEAKLYAKHVPVYKPKAKK